MKAHPKRMEHEGVRIDIEQIRREYRPSKGTRSYSRPGLDEAREWFLKRVMNNFKLSNFRDTLKSLSRQPAGLSSKYMSGNQRIRQHSRRSAMQNSPERPAGRVGQLLESGSNKVRPQVFKDTMKISPSRTMLPHFLVVPWWIVFVVLGATAVVSVSYSEGEEHQVTEQTSQENQDVVSDEMDEEPTEEGTLIQQLQNRLKELQEREQRLQQKQERVEGLQRDVEALAARQTKEAERLQKRAAELEAKSKTKKKDDPSLRHLVKVYNAMDPEEAALRIEKMDEHLALEILAGIKDKKAAVVLAGVNPKKAAMLSQGLRNFSSMKKE